MHIAFTYMLFIAYVAFTSLLHILLHCIHCILLVYYLIAYLSASVLLYTSHILKIKMHYISKHWFTFMLPY